MNDKAEAIKKRANSSIIVSQAEIIESQAEIIASQAVPLFLAKVTVINQNLKVIVERIEVALKELDIFEQRLKNQEQVIAKEQVSNTEVSFFSSLAEINLNAISAGVCACEATLNALHTEIINQESDTILARQQRNAIQSAYNELQTNANIFW